MRVVGLYDKTSDYYAPFMGEQDSFCFTNLCPRLFYLFLFLTCLGVSLHNLFSSAIASSFRFTLLPLLIYEVMGSSLFCHLISNSRPPLSRPWIIAARSWSNTSLSTSYFSSPLSLRMIPYATSLLLLSLI